MCSARTATLGSDARWQARSGRRITHGKPVLGMSCCGIRGGLFGRYCYRRILQPPDSHRLFGFGGMVTTIRHTPRHYGNDNFIETNGTTTVSMNLAISLVAADNKTETGQPPPPPLPLFLFALQHFPPTVPLCGLVSAGVLATHVAVPKTR